MNKVLALIGGGVVLCVVCASAAPAVVVVVHGAVSLVLVVGLVFVVARLAWWLTGRS